jgi:hypothetical protein
MDAKLEVLLSGLSGMKAAATPEEERRLRCELARQLIDLSWLPDLALMLLTLGEPAHDEWRLFTLAMLKQREHTASVVAAEEWMRRVKEVTAAPDWNSLSVGDRRTRVRLALGRDEP